MSFGLARSSAMLDSLRRSCMLLTRPVDGVATCAAASLGNGLASVWIAGPFSFLDGIDGIVATRGRMLGAALPGRAR